MSDQLQIPDQDTDTDVDGDGPWPGGLGHGSNAMVGPDEPVPSAPKVTNLLAVIGFALAVLIWPAGLVVSALGLVKSRKLDGVGKALSIFGLVVSVIVGTVVTTAIVMISRSTGQDPGCADRLTASDAGYPSKLYRDDNTLQQDENRNDTAATNTDISTFIADLRTYKAQLDQAITVSVHPSVKSAFIAVDGDVNTLLTGYQKIEGGDTGQQNPVMAAADRLGPDGAAITNLCSSL